MSDVNLDQVLAQMRAMSIEAGGRPAQSDQSGDFAAMFKQSIDAVNQQQNLSNTLAKEFETGNSDVSLAEVMIASQKANVSFQAMLQVRNQLVNAYKEVMNMSM